MERTRPFHVATSVTLFCRRFFSENRETLFRNLLGSASRSAGRGHIRYRIESCRHLVRHPTDIPNPMRIDNPRRRPIADLDPTIRILPDQDPQRQVESRSLAALHQRGAKRRIAENNHRRRT